MRVRRRDVSLASHFGTGAGFVSHAIAWVKLSEIRYCLVDNLYCIRLSYLNRAVNDKAPYGTEGGGNIPGLENRETWGTLQFEPEVHFPGQSYRWTLIHSGSWV